MIEILGKMRLARKIKSDKGVSILFALFAFLVCATVGSVVLAAGSSSAGRISQIADVDQRYYSAMSAAKLIRDSIDGQVIVFTRTKEEWVRTTTTPQGSTSALDGEVSSSYSTEIKQGNKSVSSGSSIPVDAAIALVLGNTPALSNENSWVATGNTAAFTCPPVTLKVEGVGELTAGVTVSLTSQGNLEFLIVSPATGNPAYKMKVVFESQIDEFVPETTKTNIVDHSVEGDTEITTSVETDVKTTTVKWIFSRMEKYVDNGSAGGEDDESETD